MLPNKKRNKTALFSPWVLVFNKYLGLLESYSCECLLLYIILDPGSGISIPHASRLHASAIA
jgi:hypothetical protein